MSSSRKRKSTTKIYATGSWRKDETKFEALRNLVPNLNMELFDQQREADFAAMSGYELLKAHGLCKSGSTLFVDSGRGTTQFIVVSSAGKIQGRAFSDGFPKEGVTDWTQKNEAADKIKAEHGKNITLVVASGALHYFLKDKDCPVVPNKGVLSTPVTTTCADFPMEFLTTQFSTTSMIAIRELTMSDGSVRRISWGSYASKTPFIDLGTGKISVVDPKTGVCLEYATIPEEMNDIKDTLVAFVKQCDTKYAKKRMSFGLWC